MFYSPTLLPEMLREALRQGQEVTLIVSSNSMAPLLRPGYKVTLASIDETSLQVGDIIAIDDSAGLIAHRFWGYIEIHGDLKLMTKGDRLPSFDPFSNINAILGRVVIISKGQNHINLDRWPGYWLNRLVTRLSLWEIRMKGPAINNTSVDKIKSPVPKSPKGRSESMNPFLKAAAYLIYRLAHFLTYLLLFFNTLISMK